MEIDTGSITSRIIEQGVLFAFMLACIAGLIWFILYLMTELKEVRLESTRALVDNTKVLTEMREIFHALAYRRD